MKDTKTKLAFIKARAEGKSYSTISEELSIAKATCQSWEQSLKADIEAMKRAQTEELYTAYNMKREARIKALGETIAQIDTALEGKDLIEADPIKLLELRLKYMKELKAEYIEPIELDTDNTLDGLLEQYNQLYIDSKTGKYSPADIKAQLSILDAKRETIYRLAEEQEKDGRGDFEPLDFGEVYYSRLIRHKEELEA